MSMNQQTFAGTLSEIIYQYIKKRKKNQNRIEGKTVKFIMKCFQFYFVIRLFFFFSFCCLN